VVFTVILVLPLADQSLAQAERAAARVNQLIGRQVAHAVQVEVQNEDAVVSILTDAAIEVLISGVPYFYNLGLTRAALRAHASMCDFGGNYELVDFPQPFGKLEAFTTAGGTSTMPWTYAGTLRTLQNKTLRWPRHYAQWKAFNDAGLISLDPVQVDGTSVIPRHLLHAVLEPQILARPGEQDMVIIRIIARGLKDGQEQEVVVDLFDYYDEATGFTAMERTTGWHAPIMAGFMARRQTPLGGVPVELAVPGRVFVEEFRKRGFDLRVSL